MLLEPVTVGSRTVRNRVLFGPHETNLGSGRAFSARHTVYYRRRAAGGAGLIVTETASVHESDWPYERAPFVPECGPGWRAIADGCHAEGSVVVAGLGHAGMQGSSAYHQRETWGPSPVPDAITRELPKEMEPADIAVVVTAFGEAAGRAMTAGMDGVEVNAGQHSLIRQFLSGLTNTRGDDWGPGEDGSGRLRFATSVLDAVRAQTGPDAIVGLRLSCDELAPWAGITPESARDLVETLAPLVDYLVVVRGSIFSADATRPDAHVPAGFNLDLAGEMRDAAAGRCTVGVQGSVVDPGQAEWALQEGRADLVEMTRALIADPDLPRLVAEGRTPRPCVRCNQKCRVRDARNPVVTCTVNPSAGFETIDRESPRSRADADDGGVVIVGAGPAGLETARVAAAAGLDVRVVEANDEALHLVRDWAAAPGRDSFLGFVEWLLAECEALGVTVETGVTATIDDVRAWRAEGRRVVLATGGRPRDLPYVAGPGGRRPVFRAEEYLAGRRSGRDLLPPGPVLVWDPVGGPVGPSVASLLAPDRDVIFACPDATAGTQLSLTGDLASASTRMLQAGITILRHVVLRAVDSAGAHVVDRFTDRTTVFDVAGVVVTEPRLPDDALWHDLDHEVRHVGDAVAPRTVFHAVLEGRRAGIDLAEGRIR